MKIYDDERQTTNDDKRRTTTNDDGRIAMGIAHMRLWLRWAKNIRWSTLISVSCRLYNDSNREPTGIHTKGYESKEKVKPFYNQNTKAPDLCLFWIIKWYLLTWSLVLFYRLLKPYIRNIKMSSSSTIHVHACSRCQPIYSRFRMLYYECIFKSNTAIIILLFNVKTNFKILQCSLRKIEFSSNFYILISMWSYMYIGP